MWNARSRGRALCRSVCRNLHKGLILALAALPLAVPLPLAATGADAGVLQEARTLLADGRAQAAYELLAPRETEWAGDRDFDYLLGSAALETGRAGEAVLSLQRAVATDPDHSAARMELARAYYTLGEQQQAAAEFRQLQAEPQTDSVRRVIDNYLFAITRQAPGQRARLQFLAELDAGYDSNANGSTRNDTFLGFTLDERNVEQHSAFYGYTLGGSFTLPLAPGLTHQSQLRISHRHHPSASFVNSDRATLSTGLAWQRGGTQLSAALGSYISFLDSEVPFDGRKIQFGGLLDLGLRQALGQRWQASLDLRGGPVRYADALEVREVDQALYVLGADYTLPGITQLRLGAQLIGGNEDARLSGSPYGRDQLGGRLTASWRVLPRARGYVYAGALRSDYDGPFFGEDRRDTQRTAGAYLVWRAFPSPKLALIPRLTYVDNQSRVDLFEYDRTEFGLSLRWVLP
jgi:outer membrane protein